MAVIKRFASGRVIPCLASAAVFCLVAMCLSQAACAIEDEEDLTIRAMVDAGLDQIAIDYIDARRRLAAGDLEIETKWVIRLSEFYAQSALRSADGDQWQQAITTVEQFESAHPDGRRSPWLQWQHARCDFLHAQSELAAYLAAPSNAQRRESILQLVRQVLRRLDDLDRDVTARRQVAARQRGGDGSEASVKQLNQLQVDASLLVCEAVWLRTQLYPPGSKDRIAAATLLTDTAKEVLVKTDATWPSRPQLEIAGAAGQLQLSTASEGLQTLRRLALEAPSESLRGTAAQLTIDYLCRQQSVSQARVLLDAISEGTPTRQLAQLQVALSDLENKSASARESELKSIVQMASEIRLRHGEYWGNRGDALLVGSGAASESKVAGGTALDLLRVEVKQLIAAGDVAGAITKLESRIELESASGNSVATLELASQTAALLHQQGDSLKASRLLSKAATDFASDGQAAKKHQLSLAYMQQALRSNATKELFSEYEDALLHHSSTWPSSPDSALPTEWLSVWLTGQKRGAELLEVVWKKSASGSLASASNDLTKWLDVFATSGEQADVLRSAESWPRSSAQSVSRMQEGVLAAGHLLATWPTADKRSELLAKVARLGELSDSSEGSGDSAALAAVYESLRCLEAARGGDLAFAKQQSGSWRHTSTPTNILRAVGAGIVDAIDFSPLKEHVPWSKALGIDSTWVNALSEARSARFKAAGLRMRGWLQGPSASIEGLEALRQKLPSDATVLLQLCRALAESGGSRLSDSTRLAKIVVKNTPATSEAHLFARWRWLANLQESGNAAKAAAEAGYFLAVSPPEDPVWKKRFEAIAN